MTLDLSRFEALRPEARGIVHSLYGQSRDSRSPFERFTLLWMAFNGWMNCVTSADGDKRMVLALANNLGLAEGFSERVLPSRGGEYIRELSTWWPVFDVKLIRRHLGVDGMYAFGDRDSFYDAHRFDVRLKRQPEMWTPGQVPRWGDFITAVYQVRCNLFHGDKASSNPGDVALVDLSHRGLEAVIEGLELFGVGRMEQGRRHRRA